MEIKYNKAWLIIRNYWSFKNTKDKKALTRGGISGRSGGSGAQRMMGLIGRGSSGAIRSYPAARSASRASPVDRSATAHDRLIQATSELDPGQIASVSVHGIVISRR